MRGRAGGASVSACGARSTAIGDSGWTGAVVVVAVVVVVAAAAAAVAVNVTEHPLCLFNCQSAKERHKHNYRMCLFCNRKLHHQAK
jgi:hypothetical protein